MGTGGWGNTVRLVLVLWRKDHGQTQAVVEMDNEKELTGTLGVGGFRERGSWDHAGREIAPVLIPLTNPSLLATLYTGYRNLLTSGSELGVPTLGTN